MLWGPNFAAAGAGGLVGLGEQIRGPAPEICEILYRVSFVQCETTISTLRHSPSCDGLNLIEGERNVGGEESFSDRKASAGTLCSLKSGKR